MASRDIEVKVEMTANYLWTCSVCAFVNNEVREPMLDDLLNCTDCGAQSRVTKKTMTRENSRG